MTKERFCEIIRELEEGNRLQWKVASAVRQYNNIIHSDYPEPFGMVIAHDFAVIECLEEIMDDQHESIDWFCCELNFGKRFNSGDLHDYEGNEIELRTPEDLYDLLMYEREYREKNEINEKN